MTSLTTKQLVTIAKGEIIEEHAKKVAEIIQRDSTIVILDVREPDEFAQGHLDEAINVPRGMLEFKVDPAYPNGNPLLFDKAAKYVVYCKSGARSALAVQTLRTLGYLDVISIAGGIDAWQSEGLHWV